MWQLTVHHSIFAHAYIIHSCPLGWSFFWGGWRVSAGTRFRIKASFHAITLTHIQALLASVILQTQLDKMWWLHNRPHHSLDFVLLSLKTERHVKRVKFISLKALWQQQLQPSRHLFPFPYQRQALFMIFKPWIYILNVSRLIICVWKRQHGQALFPAFALHAPETGASRPLQHS